MRTHRRSVVLALAFTLGSAVLGRAADAPTVVLLVRHAEKASATAADPPLSVAGKARARVLAHVAGDAGVSAIFVTQFQRTKATAAPLAAKLHLTPIERNAADTAGLVADIQANHAGKTVLVAGHSNTVNEILKALTGTSMDEIPDKQFDNLFVVTIPGGATTGTVTHLKYGARTP
jgi:broad specificity phosphatase PhoE